MKKTFIFTLIALPIIAFSVAGCATSPTNAISKEEINRLVQTPKLQATEVDGNLRYLANFKGTPTHLTGRVLEIQHPQISSMPDGEKFEWVPIVIDVQSSNQTRMDSRVVLRLYPLVDNNDSLLRLSVGDEVIALTSKMSTTETGLQVYTLGNLYQVLQGGSIVQFDSGQTVEGKLADFKSLLGIY